MAFFSWYILFVKIKKGVCGYGNFFKTKDIQKFLLEKYEVVWDGTYKTRGEKSY